MTTYSAQSIVFIDSRTPDIQDLLNGLQPGEVAYVLDPGTDGIQQIADILAANNLTGLSSIAIVSHGDSGALELGSSFITDANLSAHSNALAEIGASLAPGGAIQLYGCDVALGAGGQQFINDFSTLAGGASVEAATHIVGSAALGGSWTLDASSTTGANGTPVASTPFTPKALANFQGDLAASPVTEVWISATGGSNDSAIVHDDDTGNGTGTNSVTLFHESLAGNPSTNYPSSLSNLTNVALDTQDNLYFLAEQDEGNGTNTPGNNPNVIWVGTLSPELTNPTGTPTLTSIYSQGGSVATAGVITGLALDPTSKEVFFTEHQSLLEVSYAGGTVHTLATEPSTVNVFANGLALDVDATHNKAFFFSSTTSGVFTAHGTVNAVTSDAIYVDSDLTVQNSTPTQIKLSPADSTIGAGNFPVSLGLISGIAVDTTSQKLYFTTQPIHDPVAGTTGTGGIYEYDLSQGTSGTYNVIWLEPSSGSLFLSYIQIDDATNKYYVTGDQSADAHPSIYDGALSGGTAAQSPTLFADLTMTSITQNAEGLAIDNAPSLTISALSPTWTEEGTSVALISSATASDTDNTALFGAAVTISSGFFAGDTLTDSTTGTTITSSYNSSSGVLTLSGTDSFTNYQNVLASVHFHGGENPTDYGSDNSRTLTWVVNDGLLTSAPQTSSVSVLFVNDPPTLSGLLGTKAYTEEGGAVTLSPGLSVTDADDLNLKTATVKITGGTFTGDSDVLAVNGVSNGTIVQGGGTITVAYDTSTETLTLTGTDTLAHYQTALDEVTFLAAENPTNFGSNPTRTITWQAMDPSGTTLGGQDTSSLSTTTVTITNVNDPPTLAITSANSTWTEEQTSPSTVSVISGATASDPDNLNLASATVSISGGSFFTGDTLSFTTTNNITGSYNSNTGVLVFSGVDSFTNYDAALQSVQYNGGENPTDFGSDTHRTITWVLNDGVSSNNLSTAQTATVSVVNVNDPPTLAVTSANATWTEEQTLPSSASVISSAFASDPDNLSMATATVAISGGFFTGDTLSFTNSGGVIGSYNSNTGVLVFTGSDTLSTYDNVLQSVRFSGGENPTDFGSDTHRTLTWTVNDGALSSAAVTATLSVVNVNDPPTLAVTSANSTWTEEQTSPSTVSVISGATASDPDNLSLASATVSITGGSFFTGDTLSFTNNNNITGSYNSNTGVLVFSGVDSFTNYDAALASVQYNGGENPTDFGSDTHRTLAWTVNDGTLSSAAVSATLSVVNVNDPPTLAVTSANSTWTEEQTLPSSASVISSAFASDPDNLSMATATVAISGGFFTGDTLSFTNSGGVIGSYNSTTGVLVFTNADTLSTYDNVLQSVRFSGGENPTDFGSDTHRTLTWTVNDGALSSAAVTATLSVVNVNDPPILALGTTVASWTEEGTLATLSPTVTVTDADDLNLVSASVQITGGTFANDGDVLSATGTASISMSYNSTTEMLTLTGTDTLADYKSVLQTVTFQAGENPTDFGSNLTRTLTWTLNDGSSSFALSTAQTSTVSITFVNDPPTLANVAASVPATPTSTVTLSPSVTITDADDQKLASATVSITGGTFAGDGDVLAAEGQTSGTIVQGGNTITVAYNTTTETLTLTGSDTLAQYQTVLDTVTWHSTAGDPTNSGANPNRTISWVVQDPTGVLNGGSDTSTPQTETLTIDTPPTLSGVAANAFWTEEASPTTLSNAITISDPDGVNTELSATVSITGGTFANDHDVLSATPTGNITVSYNSSTETLTLTGSDSLANYQTVLDSVIFNAGENPTDFGSNPTRSITWTVADHLGTESAPATTTVTVVNVNDPPTLSNVATTAAFTEHGAPVTLSSNVSVTDPDNLKLVSATVSITGGTFANDGDVLAATGNGTITASYDSTNERLILTGSDTLANYQTVLDSVTFNAGENPTDFGSNPTRTLTWVLNDGSGSFALSTPVTSTISITNVNDPPTLSNVATTASYTEEGVPATLSSAVSVSDPDNVKLASATVSIVGGTFAGDGDTLAAATAGTSIAASYNTSTETLTLTGSDTLANYQSMLDHVTFAAGENPTNFGSNATRTLTWVLNDGSASSALSTPVTSTVSITNVNDPPTLSNVATSQSFTEHGGPVTLSSAVSVSDPDNLKLTGATVSIAGGTFAGDGDVLGFNTAGTSVTASYNSTSETLTLSGSDTLAHYQTVLDTVTFTAGPENPANSGSNPTRTVTWVLNDGFGSFNLSAAVTSTVSITSINDAPTLSNVATTASFTEEGAPATLSGSVSVSDPDDVNLSGATVKITGGTFAGDGDVLAATTTGTGVTASYNSSTETLTLSGADTLAHYQTLLDSITFSAGENPTNFASNPTRTVTWTLMDPSGTLNGGVNVSTPVTSTVSITNVNDPPTLSNVATSVNVHLAQPTVTVSPNVTITDPDNLTLKGAIIAIAGGTFAGDGDVLAATTTGTAITASYSSSTETLTLTGTDTLAHYAQVLDSVTFASNSPNPTNSGADKTRTLSWVVNDGSGSNNLSAPAATTIGFGGSVPYDFNGDGKSDLLFQNATNATPQIWLMNGTSVISQTMLAAPPVQWKIVGSGDFNGDGKADILWLNTNNNDSAIWEMNGTTIIGAATLPGPPSSWRIAGIGDFNGDGMSDILWQNSNGQPSIWEMNGLSVVSAVGLPTPPPQWKIVATGDFNGDGRSDILWINTNSNQPSIWEMNGTSIISAVGLSAPPSQWEIVGTGDFNGDGNADILWLNTVSNQPSIWEMNGTSVISAVGLQAPPSAWRLIGTSDINGDGKSDLLWQNINDGTVTAWEMNGTSVAVNVPVGTPGAAWVLNNNDPPLPTVTQPGTSGTANGNGTMHLSAPDMANANGGTMHMSMPDTANGASALSQAGGGALPPQLPGPLLSSGFDPQLSAAGGVTPLMSTTVTSSMHLGGG